MVDTQYKKGVLFLADVVNYTSQSTDLGTEKTKQFNQFFEKKIRQLTEEYKGNFIKRIGDAVLIFFREEENFLDFVIHLKEFSKTRALDCDDFFADLRMIAHYGKFSFEFFDQKISDLIGPEGIKVFRMEKYARTYDVELLITETLLDFLEDELKRKNINKAEVGKETLKGFNREVTLYKLIFPEKEDIDYSNLLWVKMAELEAETKEIPVFGELYPAMSMEDNFINLDAKTGFMLTEEENLLEKEEFDVDEMMGIAGKREKEFHKGKPHRMPYVDVKELYETQDKGIILGLPGSGKTTILKYFAYREFKHNRQRKKDEKQRLVLFIPCGNIMSYTRWYRQAFPREKESETVINVETILNYLTHCFLFKKEEKDKKVEKDIKKAERLVHQAYHQGRLTILVDALDESLDKDVKEKIIASVKTLFLDSKEGKKEVTWVYLDSDGETMVSFDALFLDPKEGKQESTRIYLTSRYSERETYFCGKNAEVLQPVFEVRPLDMEQLREMAEYFYTGKPKLFKAFDEVVWKEEIAAKVGGTPLTALLVIAYFEIFRKFDTRYFMYDVIVIFILVRVWKQVKEKNFNMDMRTFFREARSKRVLKEQKSAKKIYDALTLLSYEHMDKGRVIHEEDIIGIFQKFAKLVAVNRNAAEEAESWLEQMKADHMLISAGGGEYVFMHSTVMEYLAARYIVEKFNDPLYLEEIFKNKHYIEHLAQKDPMFFQSEILPITMGSGIKNGVRILRFIKNCILNIESKEIRTRFYNLAYKSLAEFESFIDRQYQRTRVELLHHDIETEIAENRDAIGWVYQCLKSAVLIKDKRKLKTWIETFQNISRLSRPDFLEKYLDYDTFSEGGSEIVLLREDLLKKIVDQELLDNWLQKHRKEEERKFLDAEKEQIEKAGGSVLTLDSSEYNPEDKNFKYYQEYSGKELAGFLGSPNFKHNGPVTCVACSQDGKYIVSGSSDSTVKLWERSSGKEVRTFKGHERGVNSICFSPEGTFILSGSSDSTLKLWGRSSGKEVHTFKGHERGVNSVCFSPEWTHILSGSSDSTVKLWERSSGNEVSTFKGHNGRVWSVCFSPEGTHILSGSSDSTVKLWERSSENEVSTFKGHKDWVRSVCFSPEGTHILSGSSDSTVKLWDRTSGKEVRTFKGHRDWVRSVCFSPEGKYILSGSSDSTVKLWDRTSGKEVRTFKGHTDWVRSVCFSPEGAHILSGSSDYTLKLWERSSGKEVRTFKGHERGVNSICFSPEGTHILSGSSDSTVKLWERSSGNEMRTFKGHNGYVLSVCFSPEGTHILSGSSDSTVKLWDRTSGKEVRTLKGHNGRVWSVCFSPEGTHILSGSSDSTVKLWERSSGKEVRTFKGHNRSINSVCLSPEGTHILSGSSDSTVKLWDRTSGKEVRTFKGHSDWVRSVCFSPEGKYILSGSSDSTVKLWDRTSGNEVRTFNGHTNWVRSVCFSPKGKYILSGSLDYTLKLWDTRTGACLKTIPLLWVPLEIKAHPTKPGLFATANANGTVTFFDFSEIIR